MPNPPSLPPLRLISPTAHEDPEKVILGRKKMARMSSSSSSMRKMVVVLSMSMMMMMRSCRGETCEEVLDRRVEKILYGANNAFSLYALDRNASPLELPDIFFGLGYPGDTVHTNTGLTLGHSANPDAIYACQADGSLKLVPYTSTNLPQAVVRAQRVADAADAPTYQLAITTTPGTFLGLVNRNDPDATLACINSPDRFQFMTKDASTSHHLRDLPQPARVQDFSTSSQASA